MIVRTTGGAGVEDSFKVSTTESKDKKQQTVVFRLRPILLCNERVDLSGSCVRFCDCGLF